MSPRRALDVRIEACWCEQDQSAAAAKHLHPSVAGADAFLHSSFQWLHVVCLCATVLPGPAEGLKWELEPQGWEGHLHPDRTDPAPGSHLPLAQSACKLDHVSLCSVTCRKCIVAHGVHTDRHTHLTWKWRRPIPTPEQVWDSVQMQYQFIITAAQ